MAEEHQGGCAAMAGPAEAHKELDPFVGTFKATVKIWMGPGEPHVSTGTMVNSWELDGRFLKQHYTGDAQEGPFPNFHGRGYWGYNTATKKYEGFWIDTASTEMQTQVGDVDATGRIWSMVGDMTDPQGKTIKKRSVITLEDNDHNKMEMFFSGPDGKEFKGMEIRYERA